MLSFSFAGTSYLPTRIGSRDLSQFARKPITLFTTIYGVPRCSCARLTYLLTYLRLISHNDSACCVKTDLNLSQSSALESVWSHYIASCNVATENRQSYLFHTLTDFSKFSTGKLSRNFQ